MCKLSIVRPRAVYDMNGVESLSTRHGYDVAVLGMPCSLLLGVNSFFFYESLVTVYELRFHVFEGATTSCLVVITDIVEL